MIITKTFALWRFRVNIVYLAANRAASASRQPFHQFVTWNIDLDGLNFLPLLLCKLLELFGLHCRSRITVQNKCSRGIGLRSAFANYLVSQIVGNKLSRRH